MKNKEVSGLQGHSQNVGLQNNKEVLFISKIMFCQVMWVRSIAASAHKRRCMSARAHSTAQKSHGAAMEAMARATREIQEGMACARSWLLGSSTGALDLVSARSIAKGALESTNREHIFLLVISAL